MDRRNEQGTETPPSGSLSEISDLTSQPLHPPGSNWTDSKRAHATKPSNSDSSPVPEAASPATNAVNDIVDSLSTKATIDPNLISIITEQVVKQLQSQYHLGSAPFGSLPAQYIPQTPQSPDFSPGTSIPPLHTPPSPRRDSTHLDPNHNPLFPGSGPTVTSVGRNKYSNPGPGDENTPRNNENNPRALRSQDESVRRPVERSSVQRGGTISEVGTTDDPKPWQAGVRVESPRSQSDLDETTILERAWQPMFEDGRATARLGQFLRGLANHLVETYEPKRSLVVTPAKMLRFFEETRVSDEVYPWSTIFGKMKHSSISVMYRKLLCQHHFVQIQAHDQPHVPGLTPTGFDTLMTCLILAHPDVEFQRLARAVKNMPISNADDSRERFPKELSRRLFPAHGQVQSEQRMISSLNHEISLINLDHAATTMPPPPVRPPPQHSASAPAPEWEPTHSARSPQGSTADIADDDSPPAVLIERERKPYYAKERGGKLYNRDETQEKDADRAQDATRPYGDQYPNNLPSRPPQGTPGLSRTTSYKTPGRHNSFPAQTIETSRKPAQPPPTSGTYPNPGRRMSSPTRFNQPRTEQPNAGNGASGNDPRRYMEGRPLERARTANDDDRSRQRSNRIPPQGPL